MQSQTITYSMLETVDNKADCTMAWEMLAISCFIESFKFDKVCELHILTTDLMHPQNQKSIEVRLGDRGGQRKGKWRKMM